MKYGYVRVSTKDQNIDRQISAMHEEKIEDKYIYIDQASGATFERKMYRRLLKRLKKDDVLVIKSIDRLGRNYDEIMEQWRYLLKEKQINIEVLDFPLLNTNAKENNITGKLISDLTLQIMSYVSHLERDQMKQRQKEGIVEAQKKGKRFGRPPIPIPANFNHVAQLWAQSEITIRTGAEMLQVSRGTFHRWLCLKKIEKNSPKK